jgi:hypothetical protein
VFVPLIAWFLHVENNSLTVTAVDIESEVLPESFSGLRIVHLSDLHNKTFGRDQQRLVEIIRELAPDLIVDTGDLIGTFPRDDRSALSLMESLVEIAPVYYVTGNHEWGSGRFSALESNLPEWFDLYATLGLDLVLSGHAHGGQVRLPLVGGLVAPDQGFSPDYYSGLHQRNATQMIVSRGLGNSIIPQRLFNRPEVIVLILLTK